MIQMYMNANIYKQKIHIWHIFFLILLMQHAKTYPKQDYQSCIE